MLARAEAQRVYGAARESHNERTRNTLKHSTCSHTVSGGRHLKARSLVWSQDRAAPPPFLLLMGLQVDWWWLLLRKRRSWDLSLTESSVVSSSSHLCLIFLSLGAILWPSAWSLTHMVVLIRWVFPLFPKMVADIIAPKLSIIFVC